MYTSYELTMADRADAGMIDPDDASEATEISAERRAWAILNAR